MCFIPETSGTYSLTTNSSSGVNTYLYFVNPETTAACLFDDDSAGNLQATLTTQLVAGKRYFIVVSAFNITTQSGKMGLNIIQIN